MEQFVIKFFRWDRQPDPAYDHGYGDEVDAIIDELAGGADRLARGSALNPSATVEDTRVTIILHEDGPEMRFDPLPGYPDVDPPQLWPLATAWMAGPPPVSPGWERQIRVEHGGHRYEGRPADLQQFARILEFFQALDPVSPAPPTDS